MYAHTWQNAYRLRPYHKAPSKPVMLGEGQSPKREKGKAMKKGRTLGFIVLFLSGFLATTTSVYADHFAAAGVKYPIPDDTSVQFWFLRVASPSPPGSSEFRPVIPTQFECIVVHKGTSVLFRLFASLKEIESIEAEHIKEVDTEGNKTEGSKFVVAGKVRSHIVFVSSQGARFLTEVANFTMTLKDVDNPPDSPPTAKDSFDLAFVYSQNGIGALLHEALPDLVNCLDHTCTLTLAENKTVEGEVEGEIEAHTSGGE